MTAAGQSNLLARARGIAARAVAHSNGWASRCLCSRLAREDELGCDEALRTFEEYFVAHIVLREWLEASDALKGAVLLSALGTTTLGLLWLVPRLKNACRTTIAIGLLMKTALHFPVAANHLYLEAIVAMFIAITPADMRPRRALLSSLQLLTALVLWHSGMQKILYGTYAYGSYVAFRVTDRGFGELMSVFAADGEVTALQAMIKAGRDGPYLFHSWLPRVVSNLVYGAEIALSISLLVARTRPAAVAAGIVFVACIEAIAFEFAFGLLMINLLALFASRRLSVFAMRTSLALLAVLWMVAVSSSHKIVN
jgi:hypothetical protein